MTEYDVEEYRRLFKEGMLKDNLDAKNYISKFFHPLTTGQHALIEKGTISLIGNDIMNQVNIKRWDKNIKKWYEMETNPKKIICDLDQPMVGNNFINTSKQLKHTYVKYKNFNDKIKKGVQTMLKFIKEVWTNNDEEVYEYVINWLSDMVKGKKNQSCLYAKSIEGVGKSTLPEFIRDFVIGLDIYLKGKSDHLKGEHNLQMLGKILVVFEELQIFSEKEWHAVDAELKDLITDAYASYTDKYEKRFDAPNVNNYMILTNFDLKGAHGRRMVVLEINPKYLNNFAFFEKIREECFNDEVGHAFFCYLKEIDTTNFKSNIIPETKKKRDLYIHLLPAPEKFLKKYFVLRQAGINMKCCQLFEMYRESEEFKQGTTPFNFYSHLSEIGFNKKIVKGYDFYKITYDELLEFGKKRKWFAEADKEITDDLKKLDLEEDDNIYVNKQKYLALSDKVTQLEDKVKMLVKISEMKDDINNLKNNIEKINNQYNKVTTKRIKFTKEDVIIEYDYDDYDDHPDILITKNDFDIKYNYFISKSGKLIKVDSDDDEDMEEYIRLKDKIRSINKVIKKEDFDIQDDKPKISKQIHQGITKDFFDIQDDKPKKSKQIHKVITKESTFTNPEDGKTYEVNHNDDLEFDEDLL